MEQKIIERLEVLVEELSGCYTSIPAESLNELNDLTKNGWTEEEYIEFIAEYWCRSTLEETVSALLHNGEYPDNLVTELYFWKNNQVIDLPEEKTMFKLRKMPETVDEEFVCHFDDLPFEEFYNWLKSHFTDWRIKEEISEEEMRTGSFEVEFECGDPEEYGRYKDGELSVHSSKMIYLRCCNLYENEKKAILAFADKHNFHLFERWHR